MAEHWRFGRWAEGNFCCRCGQPCNLHGDWQRHGNCKPNPELVEQLREMNTPEAFERRKFKWKLKHGK